MAEQLELGNIVELQKQSQQNVVAYHHGHPEVSPIKCDVRECVVRTSDSLTAHFIGPDMSLKQHFLIQNVPF